MLTLELPEPMLSEEVLVPLPPETVDWLEEYSNHAFVDALLGLTDPFKVALFSLMLVAEFVVTLGALPTGLLPTLTLK